MPKSILEFQLPEEQEEFEAASKAMDYHLAIYDIQLHLRNTLKYGELPDEIATAYQEISDFITNQVNSRGLKGYWNS